MAIKIKRSKLKKLVKNSIHYKYVEIGTCDNTYSNLCRKFPNDLGISVEPIKEYLDTLPNNDGKNVKINVAISHKNGTQLFNKINNSRTSTKEDGSGWKGRSSLQSLEKLGIRHKHRFVQITVPVITFNSLIEMNNIGTVDILSIDTEGHDFIIMEQVLNSSIKPKKIIYEHIHIKDNIDILRKKMIDNNYKLIKTTWLNDIHILNEN
jgi:FkbM family methyltransferase